MKDFINKYFKIDADNVLSPPATNIQLIDLENQLDIKLPKDYKDFLLTTNGFDGFIGDFYCVFSQVDDIIESTKANCTEFFPWALCIGTNGNLEMYVIDKRANPFVFGLLPNIGTDEDFIPLGDTFGEFIKRLYDGTAYGK